MRYPLQRSPRSLALLSCLGVGRWAWLGVGSWKLGVDVGRGLLIAFEGLDQSGKQTQAEALCTMVVERGRTCRLLSFPDYGTPIGLEISKGLHGERDYAPDVMQLL